MKKLLFLCGPNGVGKTSIGMEIVQILPHSAYIDSDPFRYMNPYVLDDRTIPTISKNISDLILNYFACPVVETVVFTYGFHGRRIEVFESVMQRISASEHQYVPYLLWCDEDENIRRMKADGREIERIKRAIHQSREAFENVPYKKIDITKLSAHQAANIIIADAGLP